MEKIIIVGGGGHAKSVINIIKKTNRYEIIGYVDQNNQGLVLNVPFLGTDNDLTAIKNQRSCTHAALGIGYIEISSNRYEIFHRLKELGFQLPAIVSPTAVINENVQIDEGSIVHDGAVINADTKIGKGVIVNNGCSIDHDCYIGDFAQIAPGVVLGGGVKIGHFSIIGLGAQVIQYKTIGEKCYVGAGATVVSDCLQQGKYVGTPAKIKENEKLFT